MSLKTIEFYFDLSSPYAFLSVQWIEGLARQYDRDLKWIPIMLGVMFKETKMAPLFDQPLRGPYGVRDFLRSARLENIDVLVPERFPYLALKPSRAFYCLAEQRSDQSVAFIKACFERYFLDGVAPDNDEEINQIANTLKIDGQELLVGLSNSNIKQRLKDETQKAIDKGVFGAPFFIIDGEPFWGNDRKAQIEQWLKTGGW